MTKQTSSTYLGFWSPNSEKHTLSSCTIGLALLALAFANVGYAAEESIADIYEASRSELIEGYQSRSNELALEYSSWQAASTVPAAPGVHGKRYLMTFVNDLGFDAYVEYASQDVEMPIGTVIAKESFEVTRRSRFKAGPLFVMEKVDTEDAPETNGWVYSGVNRNGSNMRTRQSYCHNCHQAYANQDYLGYPAIEARLGTAAIPSSLGALNLESADIGRGEQFFRNCMGCHQLGDNAANGIGPMLSNLIGRSAGSSEDFEYSDALNTAGEQGLIWNAESIFEWLRNPSDFLRTYFDDENVSSKMPIGFAEASDRNDVIAYLRSLQN